MLNHKITGMILTGTLAACLSVSAMASTAHFNDSSVTGKDSGWEDWTKKVADCCGRLREGFHLSRRRPDTAEFRMVFQIEG
ncbi:hypothetical protein [Porcincola intestinalis]|uniref:hypothetical protein n=1 Tax=Porcincola intestinalis TaxID=2606632 RepID=UPI001F3AA532|nr:hypothetical protein [Porcincola intestinalis]